MHFLYFLSSIKYVKSDGTEQYHSMKNYPHNLESRIRMLEVLRDYLDENLLRTEEVINSLDTT